MLPDMFKDYSYVGLAAFLMNEQSRGEVLLATNFQQVSVDLDTGATIERILKEPRVEQQRDFTTRWSPTCPSITCCPICSKITAMLVLRHS
jgi:hypothetical protein